MARDFDGTNGVGTTSSSPISGYSITLACWFNPSTVTRAEDLMAVTDPTSLTNGIRLSLRGDLAGDYVNAGERSSGGGAQENAITTTGYSAGTWQHAAAVFASSTSRSVYLNGSGKGTNTVSRTTNFGVITRVAIGGYSSTSLFNPMLGSIAYPCVWNVALSDDEILQLSAGCHPSLVRPAAIAALWEMTGGSSPEPDIFGGYNLTLAGSPTVVANPRILLPGSNRTFVRLDSAPPPSGGWGFRRRPVVYGF